MSGEPWSSPCMSRLFLEVKGTTASLLVLFVCWFILTFTKMASFLSLSTFIVGNVNKLFYKEATSKIFVGKWNRYGQRDRDYSTTPKWSQIVRIGGDSYNCYCKQSMCVSCHFSVQIKCTPSLSDCRQNVWNLQLLRHLVAIRCDRSSYCPRTSSRSTDTNLDCVL